MTNQKPNPIIRLLPSFTDLAFLMPFVYLFARLDGASQILEGDTGWHLRTGEWIIANGRIPYHDIFSYSRPGEPWYAWEWLWDVVFAWIFGRGGMGAVVLVSIVVISLTFALLYRLAARRSGNVLISAAVTLLALAASSVHWWARPHVFTWLFIVIALYILEDKREGRRNLLWLLPPITVLWTNLHGGFMVGIVLLGTYAAGEIASALFAADGAARKQALLRSRPYLVTAAGCLLASLCNPFTYHLHVHIARYLANPDSPFFRFVGEWQTLSFHAPAARFFEVMLILAGASAAWHASRRRFIEPLLILSWLHFALGMGRNIPLFAIFAVVPVAQAGAEVLHLLASNTELARWARNAIGTLNEISEEIGALERIRRIHAVSVLTFAAIALLLYIPGAPSRFQSDYDPKKYPVQAVQKLTAEARSERIFTTDEWGDYLIWTLAPKTRVFIDGRFDFYGEKFTVKYLDLVEAKYDWAKTLDDYRIRFVLLPIATPLTAALKESSRWNTIYDDGVSIMFRQKGEKSSVVVSHDGKRSGDSATRINKRRNDTL
ncbi:MAG: hypothetical protein JJE04_21350 [Acidobacteriia bacterium]|nr:hypothetical protein [Terriglobia bacterium]